MTSALDSLDRDAGTRGALEGAPEIPYTWNFYKHQSPVRRMPLLLRFGIVEPAPESARR